MTVVSTLANMGPYQETEKRERILSYSNSGTYTGIYGPLTGDREKGMIEASSSAHGALIEIVIHAGK